MSLLSFDFSRRWDTQSRRITCVRTRYRVAQEKIVVSCTTCVRVRLTCVNAHRCVSCVLAFVRLGLGLEDASADPSCCYPPCGHLTFCRDRGDRAVGLIYKGRNSTVRRLSISLPYFLFGRALSWGSAFAVCIVHCSLVYQFEHSGKVRRAWLKFGFENFYSSLLSGSASFLCAALMSPQRTKQYCPQIEHIYI